MLSLIPGFQKSHHYGRLDHGLLLHHGSWPVHQRAYHSIRGLIILNIPQGMSAAAFLAHLGPTTSLFCAAQSLGYIQLFVTPWTAACQAPPALGFSRQGYWSGLPFPPLGDLPDPGIEPTSAALAGGFFMAEPPGSPQMSLDVVRCPLGEEKKCTPSRESLIMEYFGYVHLLTIEEVEDGGVQIMMFLLSSLSLNPDDICDFSTGGPFPEGSFKVCW